MLRGVVLVALLVSACSGGGNPVSPSRTADPSVPTPTPTPTPTVPTPQPQNACEPAASSTPYPLTAQLGPTTLYKGPGFTARTADRWQVSFDWHRPATLTLTAVRRDTGATIAEATISDTQSHRLCWHGEAGVQYAVNVRLVQSAQMPVNVEMTVTRPAP